MIRAARAEDAGWIAGIWNGVIEGSTATFTTVAKTQSEIADLMARQIVLVDTEAGFATFGPFRGGPGYAHVAEHTIYLDANTQGQGRGRRLLAALEDVGRGQGLKAFVGGISGSNEAALQFHLAMGYTQVGRLPGVGQKWGAWLDLVLVQKNLQDCA